MIISTPVRALIFDFDGVLADTETAHCAAFVATLAEIGLPMTRADYFAHYLGLPDRECLAAACAQAGRQVSSAQLAMLLARKRVHVAPLLRACRLYPGISETLRRLHAHFILAIASGAFRDEIAPILERQRVRQLFCTVVGADDVRAGKPAPDPFLRALQEIRAAGHQVDAADCLVIEDSPRGIAAAHAASMRCVGITTHYEASALAPADAIVDHVTQLRPEDLMPSTDRVGI